MIEELELLNFIQRTIQKLADYKPELTRQPDHFEFWEANTAEFEELALRVERKQANLPTLQFVDCFDLSYAGCDGTRVTAWYLVPKTNLPVPGVVVFPGYTCGRGLPEEHVLWAAAGFAVLAVDARAQGGETGSNQQLAFGSAKGWITQGILDPSTSYLKFLIGDAYRAVNCLAAQPEIDPNRMAVAGSSQGGGLSLWATALNPRVKACAANVPNLCHLDYSIFASTGSVTEAADFIRRFPEKMEQVLKSLSYFDFMNSAEKVTVPILMSVGLQDRVCPPEAVYAAYNHITSPKHLEVYPFSGHHVEPIQTRKVLHFLQKELGM
jgi:cephalosporin-C deacetylase